jgi:hypothetical protein
MNWKRNHEKEGEKWCTLCLCYVKKCKHMSDEKRGPSYNMGYEEYKGLK